MRNEKPLLSTLNSITHKGKLLFIENNSLIRVIVHHMKVTIDAKLPFSVEWKETKELVAVGNLQKSDTDTLKTSSQQIRSLLYLR